MSGMKSITLLDGKSEPIHPRYRYKLPRSALNRAVTLMMEGRRFVQIWDLAKGRMVAEVSRTITEIRIGVKR